MKDLTLVSSNLKLATRGTGQRVWILTLLVASCVVSAVSTGFALPPQPKEKPPTTYSIPLPPLPDFSRLDWLVGEWSGKTGDQKPQGDVHLNISYDLGKRVMVFRESVSIPAANSVPATSETWIGILTPDNAGAGYILRVFSSTGFVTRFRVTAQEAEIQFNPEGGGQPPPGWLFRRKLTRTDTDAMTETVEASPPQKPFFEYFTAKLTRKRADESNPK